jgi:hypothetical protein
MTDIVSLCEFADGGMKLLFDEFGEVPERAGIQSESGQWVAIRRDEGLLIVPEEYLEVNKP